MIIHGELFRSETQVEGSIVIAAEFNKTRILVLANATAVSQIIKAEGLAQSKLIIANATREAIETITVQLPERDLTQITSLYLYLETLRDIAESGKGTFIIAPGDSEQFIIPVHP